ncbi:MAG: hypothetical protein ACRDV4_12455, partial [Acidimicrobiales bacterium]
MARDYLPGPSRPVPLIDSGERERLSFWRQHAVAIPSELLEITGWLTRAVDREALTEEEGDVQPVAPGSRPSNVLFLVPQEGTRAFQSWEWCLCYLRMEQSRRRLVQRQVERAKASLEAADAELANLRTRHKDLDSGLRPLADEAHRSVQQGDELAAARLTIRLRSGLAEVRANLASYRGVERRCETARLRLEGLRDHLVPQVYPGLWARVNAFLDLQALSVANIASEEFRKVPRSLARMATRFERDLEED